MTTNQTKSTKGTTPQVPNEDWLTIKQALELTGYGNAHLRMNILKAGKVDHVRSTVPGTSIPRILVNKNSLLEYMNSTGKARNGKVSMYLTEDEIEMVLKARDA